MSGTKFLFIHPSRGRPAMARMAMNSLVRFMNSGSIFRYVMSCDADDISLPYYKSDIPAFVKLIVGVNASAVPAVNAAAAELKDEDIIIAWADDLMASFGWDNRLLEYVDKVKDPMFLMHPVDMDHGQEIPVVQIMSAPLYRRLGYFMPPMYVSMYADNDLLESCQLLGVVHECAGLGFDHLHPHYGKGTWDDTYARENRPEAYASGLSMLKKRRSDKFGLKL